MRPRSGQRTSSLCKREERSMSRSAIRRSLLLAALALVGAAFSVGTLYGSDAIRLVARFVVGPPGAEYSRFVRRDPNNSKVLVFIHGVTGTPTETWTNLEKNVYWPNLVKEDKHFDGYDVFALSYLTPLLEAGPSIGS